MVNRRLVKIIIGLSLTGAIFYVPGYAQDHKTDIREIKLNVSAPFSDATLTIDDKGLIKYVAESPGTGIDSVHESSQLTPEQHDELVSLLVNNDFFNLEDKYTADRLLMDATCYTITVQRNDASVKSVSCCHGSCPEQVSQIIDMIKKLWGKEILEVGV